MSTDFFSGNTTDSVQFDVFEGLSETEVQSIIDATSRKMFSSGEALCRQGGDGQSMFFILNGRVQISVKKLDQSQPVVVNTLGPGQHFGEMSMLNRSPRTATATATMETEVASLDHEHFQQLVNSIPGFTANLSRTLVAWLRGQLSGEKASRAIRIAGIVRRGKKHARLAPAVAQAIANVQPSITAWSATPQCWDSVKVKAHQLDAADMEAFHDLDSQVEKNAHTILDFDAETATARHLLQCERVFWVLDRDQDDQQELEKIRFCIDDVPELARRLQIIEVHEKAEKIPVPLAETLSLQHPALRIQRQGVDGQWSGYRIQDIARLQHLLQGVTLGLVLGGGGARGMAHIGVIEALEQKGIYFDTIAGTSAGSIVGCAYSAGMTPAEILRLINMEMTPPKWVQKLPSGNRLSLFADFRLGKIEKKLRKYLYDYTLQQLLVPMCTVAVDLVQGNQIVSSVGDAVSSIRASANHPAFGSPIMKDGHALVDGGILNNVPATVLRNQGADFILTIDVSSELDAEFGKIKKDRRGNPIRKVGYMNTLLRVLDIIQRGHSKTHIVESDFVVTPKCAEFPFEDFTRANELYAIGRDATDESIEDLTSTLAQFVTVGH